jgi:soluble lytic murein transglycosylase
MIQGTLEQLKKRLITSSLFTALVVSFNIESSSHIPIDAKLQTPLETNIADKSNTIHKPNEQYRAIYTLAIDSLKQKKFNEFEQYKNQLKEYNLYPYLIYSEIKQNFSSVSDKQVKAFLNDYADIPVSKTLLTQWLYWLAKNNHKQRFLDFYDQRKDNALSCFYNYSLVKKGRLNIKDYYAMIDRSKALWLVGHSQSKYCDPLFQWLNDKEIIDDKLLWQRINLSMQQGNIQLANYLAKKLSVKEKEKFSFWKKVHYKPKTYLSAKRLREDNLFNRQVISHGLYRYARVSLLKSYQHWQKVKQRYTFTKEQRAKLSRDLALRLAYRYHPEAYKALTRLSDKEKNMETKLWRIRTALNSKDWIAVSSAIKDLPKEEQQTNDWQYWLARTLEETGKKEEAKEIYRKLAEKRSYYGFIAADRLGQPYQINHEPIEKDKLTYDQVNNNSFVSRAKELNYHQEYIHARREWFAGVNMMNDKQKVHAAKIAHDLGWYTRAISTIARSKHLDDLDIRFPTPFKSTAKSFSKSNNIDLSWTYSIMRRESAFNTHALSRVGAKGLMQLMPATAKYMGKKLKLSRSNYTDLYNPKKNIRLGTSYLNYLKQRFNGNQTFATIAYNAGPHRVEKWKSRLEHLSVDAWIDTIPFKETRNYVKAILAYQIVFEWKLGNTEKRIKDQFVALRKYKHRNKEV